MKKTDLELHKGKKLARGVSAGGRSGVAGAQDKREQALARKRELLERLRKPK